MDLLLYILSAALVYFILVPLLNSFLLAIIREKDVKTINEYVELLEFDVLEQNILQHIYINEPTQDNFNKHYGRLTENQLNKILDKFCELKVLDKSFVRYFLKRDKYFSLNILSLSDWECKILEDFWEESLINSFNYKELLQKYTRPAESELTFALMRLSNCGAVVLTDDNIYLVDISRMSNDVRMHKRSNEYQNNE